MQAALRLREIDPDPPQAGLEHPFNSEPSFSVMMPARGTTPDIQISGALTEIGGSFEAWTFHDEHLVRVWRGQNRNATLEYLRKYRESRIQDGAKDSESFRPTDAD
jgi:hypothetical protein